MNGDNSNNNIIQMKVPTKDLINISCECKNIMFIPVIKIKQVPALLSPTGQAGIVFNQEGFQCSLCSKFYTLDDLAKGKEE